MTPENEDLWSLTTPMMLLSEPPRGLSVGLAREIGKRIDRERNEPDIPEEPSDGQ